MSGDLLFSENREKMYEKSSHAVPHNSSILFPTEAAVVQRGKEISTVIIHYKLSNWRYPLLDSVGNGLPYQDHIFTHRICVFPLQLQAYFFQSFIESSSLYGVYGTSLDPMATVMGPHVLFFCVSSHSLIPFMHELRRPKSGFFSQVFLVCFRNDQEKPNVYCIYHIFGYLTFV